MRVLAGAVAVAILLALPASVEAIHRTGEDRDFASHYNIQGRLVNDRGFPVSGVDVSASLLGITGIDRTSCGGNFNIPIPTKETIGEFAEVKVTAKDQTKTLKVNIWSRRTDVTFVTTGGVSNACANDREVEGWLYRYTVEGRLVERIDAIDAPGGKLFARPIVGETVEMAMSAEWTNLSGGAKKGVYEARSRAGLPTTDGAGNFAFSFTVADELDGGFKVDEKNVTKLNVTLKDRVLDVQPDYLSRYSYVEIVRGAAGGGSTPAPAVALALGAVAAAILLAGRRRA